MSNNNSMSSSTMGAIPSTMGDTSGQQTTIFHDAEAPDMASIVNQPDMSYMDGGQTSVSLSDYLRRPVMMPIGGAGIYHVDWDLATGHVGKEIFRLDPWEMWRSIPPIAAKMKNFAYFRGKLHLKFKIQSTQFHYGLIRITYDPYGNTNTVISNYNNATSLLTVGDEGAMMHHSTMMGAELSACDAQGAEMILPYVNFKNWLEIPVSWDTVTYEQTNELGTIIAHEMAPLRTTSVSSVAVRITMFAWMDDAVLSTPTIYSAAGGEMPISPGISNVASAVADAAGKLSKVPVIGRFAKATSMASSTVGNIASLFGFSKPPDISSYEKAKVFTTGDAVTTNGTYEGHRLVLDARQELNIDPRTAGLDGTDEMTFDFICKKECFLTSSLWQSVPSSGQLTSSGTNISQLIFHANVTPFAFKLIGHPQASGVADLTADTWIPTPAAFVARVFDFWRGTMVYRFRVIASGFHKGSLRIAYDPLSPEQSLASAYDESGLNQMSQILDLDEIREVTFRVPWSSQYPYLQIDTQRPYMHQSFAPNARNSTFNEAKTKFSAQYHNGVITAQIVNPLISPNEEPVNVIVSSWFEDCEFQAPSERITYAYPQYTALSAIIDTSGSNDMSSTCFGEKIVSLRSLLKRPTMAYNFIGTTTAAASTVAYLVLPQFPLSGDFAFTADERNMRVSYLTYFSNAYMGRRGGVRYLVRPYKNVAGSPENANYQWQVTRKWDCVCPGTATSVDIYGVANQGLTLTSPSLLVLTGSQGVVVNRFDPGYEGTAQASTSQEPFPCFEVPHHSTNRFTLARYNPKLTPLATTPVTFSSLLNPTELGYQYFTLSFMGTAAGTLSTAIYASGAEDLSFFWFQAPPPVYTTTAPP